MLRRNGKDHSYAEFYRNDAQPDDRLELTLVRDSSRPNETETFSGMYMYTPEQFDALYTALTGRNDYQPDSGRRHNYVQEKIIRTTNLPRLMQYAAVEALERYGIRLTPGEYRYPDAFQVYQRNLDDTSSWVAFTVENADASKKEMDIYRLEECITDCLLFRMSIHYLGICEFAVALRVVPKLVNDKAREIREKFIADNTDPNWPDRRVPNMTERDCEFHHFEDTTRAVTSGDVRMKDNKWNERVREVTFNGETVILLMGDKDGRLTRNVTGFNWPASAHSYMAGMMREPAMWKKNRENRPEKNNMNESLLDDIEQQTFDDTKTVLTNKAANELGENPEDFEYYIRLKIRNVEPDYDAARTLDIARIFDEITEAVESSAVIPQRYFITYPVLKNSLDRNSDIDIQFTPPLPEAYSLKELYGSDYYNDVGATYLLMKIYIDRLTFFPYPRFVREMNRMLSRLHQAIQYAIPKSRNGRADGEVHFYYSDREKHGGRWVLHMHEMYTQNCYQNGEHYRKIYTEMFPEAAALLPEVTDYDAESAAVIIRKMDVRRLGMNIEQTAPRYGLTAKVINCWRGMPTQDRPVCMAYITIDMQTDDGAARVDIRTPEEMLNEAVFRHITRDMTTNCHLFIFVRTHFEVYNRQKEERKQNGYRTREYYFEADKITYGRNMTGETMTYVNTNTAARQHVKDIRVRKIRHNYDTTGYVLYFDENGRMGRKPFTGRGYDFGGDALQFIEDVVQSGLVWRPDFKPYTDNKKKK